MANNDDIFCKLAEYKRKELRAESALDTAQSQYWNYIIQLFLKFADDKYHLECRAGENFIVDETNGSEIYYLPNGFKL